MKRILMISMFVVFAAIGTTGCGVEEPNAGEVETLEQAATVASVEDPVAEDLRDDRNCCPKGQYECDGACWSAPGCNGTSHGRCPASPK